MRTVLLTVAVIILAACVGCAELHPDNIDNRRESQKAEIE